MKNVVIEYDAQLTLAVVSKKGKVLLIDKNTQGIENADWCRFYSDTEDEVVFNGGSIDADAAFKLLHQMFKLYEEVQALLPARLVAEQEVVEIQQPETIPTPKGWGDLGLHYSWKVDESDDDSLPPLRFFRVKSGNVYAVGTNPKFIETEVIGWFSPLSETWQNAFYPDSERQAVAYCL